jgi:hypothetical protein
MVKGVADSELARYLLFWMPFLMLNPPPGTVGKEVTAACIEP